MNKLAPLFSTVLLALAVGPLAGCAGDTDDAEPAAETQDELVAGNSCTVYGGWKGNTLKVSVGLDRKNPRALWFYFEGARYTISSNATVTLVHPDGSWAKYKTDDNIVDRMWTHASLHYSSGSNSGLVSHAVGPGDVFRVEAVFDLPNTGDKKCSTFLAW